MIAVVERAEREVVVEFGVPLCGSACVVGFGYEGRKRGTHGASVGVSGSGISIRVGVAM